MIPIDPTTGEFESMSATHIKLFEGMGGVLPEHVKVTAFQPPNRVVPVVAPKDAKEIHWPLNKPLYFKYTQDGKELGGENLTLKKVKRDGKDAYELTSEVKLAVGNINLEGPVTLVTSPSAMPLSL